MLQESIIRWHYMAIQRNRIISIRNRMELKEKLSSERLAEVRNRNKNRNVNLYRLYKKDERIQQIPITTNAVTLREVERVHYWLGTCWLNKNRESKQEQMDIVDNESFGGQNETQ